MLTLSEHIRKVPALWSLAMFIPGILIHDSGFKDIPSINQFILLTVLLIIITCLLCFKMFFNSSFGNLLLSAGFFLSAYGHSSAGTKPNLSTQNEFFIAEVASLPSQKSASTHIKLRMLSRDDHKKIDKTQLYINAYFSPDQAYSLPEPGKIIIAKSKLQKISNAGNPHEFDYKKYLSIRKIYYTAYLKDGHWKTINHKPLMNRFKLLSLKFKSFLQNKIKSVAKENEGLNHDLILAICTGNKSELDEEIKTSFSNAGAIHVMAVSGLHVGMIWFFLQYLFLFLKRGKIGIIIQFFLIIIILWFYAAMTGLSASVVRSVSMFTLASIGRLLNRKATIFNTLLVTSFIQILMNPNILYDAGFQFSYTAVLSILLFHPPLRKVLTSKNWLFNKILDVLNVSFSAQVLTFPLAAYYFHQLPVYFLLTNLFIIPLVTLLMMFFLIAVVFLLLPALADVFLHISMKISGLMENAVEIVNNLPLNTIQNIDMNRIQIFIFLVIPLLLLLFYLYKKFASVLLGTILVIINLSMVVLKHSHPDKSLICVFNIRESIALHLKHNSNNLLIHNDSIDMRSLDYATSGYFTRIPTGTPDQVSFSKLSESYPQYCFALPGVNNFLYSAGTSKIVLINDYSIFSNYMTESEIAVEIMILGDSPLPLLRDIRKNFHVNTIVIASSVPIYARDILLNDSTSVIYHKISREGAYMSTL